MNLRTILLAVAGVAIPSPATSPSPAGENDLARLDREIKAAQSRVGDLEKNVADLQKQVEMKTRQIAELEKKEAAKSAK